jgi:hypothetical protein
MQEIKALKSKIEHLRRAGYNPSGPCLRDDIPSAKMELVLIQDTVGVLTYFSDTNESKSDNTLGW